MNAVAKTLVAASLLLLVSILFRLVPSRPQIPVYDKKEMYDPSLARLNTLSKLEAYIDSSCKASNIAPGTINHILLTEDVLKKRFYHGFSQLTARENWIAAGCDKLFNYGLVNKVLPDDMLRHSYAACSQQGLLVQELLKRKGISYRVLRFDHHYALEVKVNDKWYFFDSNMEPEMTPEQRCSTSWKYEADSLKKYYDKNRFSNLDFTFGTGKKARVSRENEQSAQNASLFQRVTGLLSSTAWMMPMFLFAFVPIYRRRQQQPVF